MYYNGYISVFPTDLALLGTPYKMQVFVRLTHFPVHLTHMCLALCGDRVTLHFIHSPAVSHNKLFSH